MDFSGPRLSHDCFSDFEHPFDESKAMKIHLLQEPNGSNGSISIGLCLSLPRMRKRFCLIHRENGGAQYISVYGVDH